MRKHIRSFLTGMLVFASIIANAQGPALFSSATSYCEGSAGVTFGVNNSIIGNTYTLQKGPPWTTLSTITGTVGTISFPGTHQAGTYRLSQIPTPTIVITEIPLPENMYIVTGGGDYCSNTYDYPFVGLSGSQVGILYALYRNGIAFGSPQPGNGWPLNFGEQPLAGVYTIKAFRDDCERPMQGSATVNVYNPPVVSFTYTEGGIPDACGLVSFNVTVNGVLNPTTGYEYEWDFGDEEGTSNLPNPTYYFPAFGVSPPPEAFSVTLLVTDNNDCQTEITQTVAVTKRPHAHLTPLNNIWTLCNSDPLAQFILIVHNTSTTTATNTGYLINWGDGSDPIYLTPAEFPFNGSIQHLYSEKGTFPLSITVYGPTCNDTRVYPVFNGSTPAGGVTYQAGILEGCEPHTIIFRLSGEAANNAPTTLYCFNFGDGVDTCFTQEDLPPLPPEGYYSIPHTYEYHSCAEPGFAYQMTSFIQNPCSTIPNDVGGIKISRAADADFLRSEFPIDPIFVCVGVPKEFTSNTSVGCIIYGSQVYDITNYYWDFYNNGENDSEEENPVFTFPVPGLYEVKLSALTGPGIPNCGEDDMIREVCVQDVPLPSFILSQDTFCVNEILTPVNTSITEPECADPQFLWIVSPSTGYNFTGGTNATSFEPNFRFTQAGDYTITLRIRSYSGEDYCFEEFSEPFPISIISVPNVTILGELEQCGPGLVAITTDLITYDEGNGIINGYSWTVTPTGPAFDDPNAAYPELTITENITQTYELTVQIDNECGIITSDPIILHVTQTIEGNVIDYDGNLELCSGMLLTENITGSIPPALTGGDGDFEYIWEYKEGEDGIWTPVLGAEDPDLDYDGLNPLTINPTKFRRIVASGSCISESNEIVFSVSPGIENNIISADQFICTGDFPLTLLGEIPLEGGGGYSYVWHYSIYPFDNWNPAPGINTELNYEPPQLFQTTRYRRFVQSVACDHISNEVEIKVFGNIINNIIASAIDEICAGTSFGEINGSIPLQTENTSFDYQWYSSIDGVNFFPIPFAYGINYTPAGLDETTWFKRIVTASDPVPAGCNISESNVVQIVVNPNPIADADAESVTINYDTWTTLYGNASSGSPPYTNWSWSGPVLDPNSQNTLTAPLTETTTFCLTVTDSKGCEHTDCITIVVLGGPLQANPYPDTTICFGQSVTLYAGASGGNQTWEYEWSSVPPGGPYPELAEITVAPSQTTIYTVTVFDGFNYASGSVEVIVDPIPAVTSANAAIICSGDNLAYNITSTVPGTTFEWVVNDISGGCINGFSDSNEPQTLINQELVNSCSEPKTIQYIITPTGPEPTDCEGDQFTLTVTVRPGFDDTYEDQYIPDLTSTDLTGSIVGGTPPYLIYNWQPEEMISGPHIIPNPTTVLLYNDQEYTLTVTDNAGCQYVTTVMVYTTGGGLSVTCTSTVDDIICEGVSVTLIANAQGGGGGGIPELYSYGWTGIPGGATYIHPWEVTFVPALIGENDYSVEVGDGFTTTSCFLTITVNQIPTITSPAVHEMCHYTHVNYTPTSDVIGATFEWASNSNPCISGNGSGSGAINNLLTNTCNTPQSLIYTITPTGPSPTYCVGESFELVVWVNPNSTVINTPASQTVVSGQFSVPVTFSSDVEGVGYNWTSIVTCPGEISYTYVNGSGPVIPSQLIAINPDGPMSCDIIYTVYPIVSGSFAPDLQCPGNPFTYTIHVNMAPSVYTVSADTVICHGELTNIRLDGSETGVRYHLLRNGNVIAGSGIDGTNLPLLWTGVTQAGIYTVRATNLSNGAQIMMNGSAELIVRPLPLAYTLYSMQPGDSCLPVTPWLNGSQNGVIYHLHRTDFGGAFHPGIEIHVGTGIPITFGIQIEPGYYTVEAFWDQEDVICSQLMSGVITAHPLPLEFEIYPIGIICEDVEEVCINGSEDGVIYQLWLDENPIGEPLTGTGDTICFGVLSSPGTYSIHAKNPLTLCEWFFDSTIMVHPSPNIYTVSPVNGCPGVEIVLNGCQPGIHYYLFFDPPDGSKEFIQIGDFFECEDGIVNFGVHYNEGVYHVKAVNPNTTCSAWMYNTTTIWPAPLIYFMKPIGTSCPPPPINFGMLNFQPGVTYYLYRNDEVVAVDDADDGEIDFGEHVLEGLYTVKAKIEHPDGLVCWSDMNGSYLIEPQAAIYTLKPENPVCSPFAFFLNGSENGVTYELHNDQSGYQQEKSGTGGIIYFDDPPSIQAGQYWVMAKKGDCLPRQMNGIRTMLPLPTLYEIVPTGLFCTYDSVAIELSGSDIGVTYELLRIPSPVPVTIVAGTGSEISFGIHTITGTYKVKAINDATGCQRWMPGEIIINYPPIAYSITVDGIPFPEGVSFCSPVNIGIEYSQPGNKYYLYPPSGIPIILTGTGSPISFGSFETSGNYYAKAHDENTGCWTDMLGTINIYDHPEVYSLVSLDDPPAYCTGDNAAITLMLSYSQTGVKYQLFRGSAPVGVEKLGNEGPIYWHQVSQYGPGNYSVRAYFVNDTDCMAVMEGVVSIQELQRPTAVINGFKEVCESNTCTEMIVSITGSQMIEVTYTDGTDFHTLILDPVIPQHPIIVCPLTNTTYHLIGVGYYQSPYCDGTVSGSFTVEVIPSPTANAGVFKTTCVTMPIHFDDAIATNYSNISWIHTGMGNLDDYSIQNPTYTPAPADAGETLLFIMTVSGTGACSTESVQSVVQLAIEHLPQAIAGPDMTVCITENVDITGSMLYATNPVWSHNGNGSLLNPLSLTPTYIPNPLDEGLSISFSLTVYGINTCSAEIASDEFTITFEHLPSADAGPGGTICETGNFQLVGSVGHASSSLWEVISGSGSFSNPATPTTVFFPDMVTSITAMTLRLTAFGSGTCNGESAQSTVEVVVYPVPTVYAGPDAITCGTEPFYIIEATAANATEFSWTSTGSGQWLNQNQLSATYYPSTADLYNGSVILTLSVTNTVCEPESDSFVLTISHLPLAYFVCETPVCSGMPVFFNDNSSTVSGIIEQWHWDFGDGNDTTIYFPSNPDIAHIYSNMGQYNVTLTVTNSFGCIKSTSQLLSILPAPVAAYEYTTNCVGSGTIFNDLSQPNGGGAIAYWNWNFGDPASGVNNTSTQQNPVHHFTGPGVFNVQLIITSTTGCTDTLITAVEVFSEPSIAISASTDITCLQESVTFQGAGAPGSTWFWDFDDGFTSTEQNPSHTYLFPGTYNVSATITNNIGCTNSTTLTIVVHDLPLSVFSFDPPTCQGNPIQFVDYSFATEGYITQWIWNFGDGSQPITINFPNPPEITYSYSSSGTYNVTLNVTTSLGCSHLSAQTLTIIPSPVAAFTHDIICEGLLVEFTDLSQANGGGLISSWYWNFDDPLSGVNNTSNLQNPSHLFTQAGTYNVSLTISSFYGCSHTFSNPVAVSNSPQLSFTYSNDPPCDGTEVDFSGLFEGNATSWFWQFGDGGTSSVQNPSYTYQGHGTFNVVLTVTGNAPEFCQFIAAENIVVNAAPIANFIYENNCVGSAVQFTDLSFGQPSAIVSWYWNFGGINSSYEQHPTHIFPGYGQYNVTLTVSDAAGCSRTVEKLVLIYDIPFADFGYTQLCNPSGTVQFFDLSTPGFHNYPIVQWNWTFYPGNTSNQPNPTAVFPQSDIPYDVSLVVTDLKGCSDTMIITIDVWQPLNLIIQEVEPTCFGNPSFFQVNHNPADIVIISYTWEFMDGTPNVTTPGNTISHTFAFAGIRVIKLTVVDNRGCSTSEYITAVVNPLPQPDFIYNTGICSEPTQFTFLNNECIIIDYLWEFGDPEASTSILQNPEFLYSDSGGVFEVKLTVTDINGCINCITKQVVKPPCVQAVFMLPPDPPGICATHNACFTDLSYALPSNSTLVHWSWDFGDGDGINYTQFKEEICHKYSSGGTYNVKLTVTAFVNNDYFDHSVTKTIVIDSLPIVYFEADTVCLGNSTTFTNSSTGAGSQIVGWKWEFGNGENSDAVQPTYRYPESGTYPVKLIAHNASGCSDSLTKYVIVRNLPNVDFNYEMNCVTYETIFKDISLNHLCPVSLWKWDFGDNTLLSNTNGPDAVHTYRNVGAHTVSLEVTDCYGCSNVHQEIVEIHPVPKADFSYTDNYQSRQGQVLFINESTGAEAYLWDFESMKSSETNPVYQFLEDGTYEIMLVSYNEFGCPDTIVKPYHILFKGLYIPTAFVPSSTDPEVKYFHPKGINIREYRIEVFSQWGTMLWSSDRLDENGSPTEFWDGTYKGSDLPSGVYMWRAIAIFLDDCVWHGSSLGDNKQTTHGQVMIIR